MRRTEYQDDDEWAEAIHEPVPPDRAHAPPHDAITDYNLLIMFVLVNVHRKAGSEVLTYIDTDSDGHHP